MRILWWVAISYSIIIIIFDLGFALVAVSMVVGLFSLFFSSKMWSHQKTNRSTTTFAPLGQQAPPTVGVGWAGGW